MSILRYRPHQLSLVAALFASSLLDAPAWAASADTDYPHPAAAAAHDPETGDIIVTARRRKERLQDVPIAVTAISGNALRADGVSQLAQLQFVAPSVNIGTPNPRQTSVAIRGIGNNPAADGLSSSVGIYIDGVYLDRLGMADFDLLDIDRVEVLRGPQGTLFGKNTTAGAISVTTREPSFTPEVEASVDIGNYNLRQFQASVSAPLSDKVAFRVAGYVDDRDGYLTNVNIGGSELSQHRQGVRGQLLFKPDNTLSIRMIGEYGHEGDSSGAFVLYNPGPNSGPTSFLPYQTWVERLVKAGAITAAPIDNPYGLVSDQNEHQHLVQWQWGLTGIIDKHLGDFTLTSITGYRDWKFTPQNDFDWGPASVITNNGVIDHVYSFSQELRLASPPGHRLDYVLGAYYFHRALDNEAITVYGPQYSIGRGAFPGLNNAITQTFGNPSVSAGALFGQDNLHITPTLELTTGFRGTYEKSAETITRLPLMGGNGGTVAPTVLAYGPGHVSTARFTPSALGTLSWKPEPDILAYVTISYSAKAGGFNSPAVPQAATGAFLPISTLIVKPESAVDYELGFKSSLLDHHLTINGDLFLTDVKDYQANTTVQTESGFQSLITNVGSVRSKGAEIEVTARPFAGVTLNGSLGYNDARYVHFANAPAVQGSGTPTQDLSGQPVVQAPKWNIDLGGTYTTALTPTIDGYVRADFHVKSGYFGYIDDSAYSWIKGYTVTNFRVGATFAHGTCDLSAWVRNAFDSRYFFIVVPAATGSGGYYTTPAEPRTFGATLRANL